MIVTQISFLLKRVDDSNCKESDVVKIAEQIKEDSSYGTFGEIPESFWASDEERNTYNDKMNNSVSVSGQHVSPIKNDHGWYECKFELVLSEELFTLEQNGFQRLISMLSGDLFHLSMKEYLIDNFKIDSIDLEQLLNQSKSIVYDNRHHLHKIRGELNIQPLMPLLAFSIKPRVGLSLKTVARIAKEIAKEGFNIIEFDTRNLVSTNQHEFDQLLEIANEVAAIGNNNESHCRLSLNFSYDSYTAIPLIEEFIEKTPQPAVIKLDFNLDGLSTLRHVRQYFPKQKQPIITCYPLLKTLFSSVFGDPKVVTDILIASGVDIIYPGNCPQFEIGGVRKLDQTTLLKGQRYYQSILDQELVMPSIAGGVHAGELHAYYELLGPNTAFFIGGGIALHKEGPKEGAKLCVNILKEAAKLRDGSLSEKKVKDIASDSILNLKDNYLIKSWMDSDSFEYLRPEALFEQIQGLEHYFKNN